MTLSYGKLAAQYFSNGGKLEGCSSTLLLLYQAAPDETISESNVVGEFMADANIFIIDFVRRSELCHRLLTTNPMQYSGELVKLCLHLCRSPSVPMPFIDASSDAPPRFVDITDSHHLALRESSNHLLSLLQSTPLDIQRLVAEEIGEKRSKKQMPPPPPSS